jgi:hypothetical protein
MASTGGVMLLGRITYPDRLYCDRPQAQKDTAPNYYLSLRVARTVADLRGLPSVGSDEILVATGLRERTLEQEPSA